MSNNCRSRNRLLVAPDPNAPLANGSFRAPCMSARTRLGDFRVAIAVADPAVENEIPHHGEVAGRITSRDARPVRLQLIFGDAMLGARIDRERDVLATRNKGLDAL